MSSGRWFLGSGGRENLSPTFSSALVRAGLFDRIIRAAVTATLVEVAVFLIADPVFAKAMPRC